ncbi:NrdH-redoxin [candidate division WOR-1 bacterium RIFOXYA12_FULL_52_29]|uniref:NrdH-redoxin n=1 Tax=candidate division WOR-1 bacterium RIFOXYC12_FULL_54_18 TaxID=1802584 RepID=A0A1F4T7P9_UNCSA|nr:MAG: NrdH-redoxin [candidate division WOR-1 bacterium RIFOXYA2_FULL_51_19]OGC18317.1 MAG: NrdH-redoxin [candidate division WOR-1 bacterium RIFOXYA12_FULL_52_29]OGC27172.1 MAG: NrdH-redoxin [candidate division WOR-1 bacterium RIFOXYB2_FULL_45_9]OGC28734.1 MAG: NrdH-redoxin [candidate division WOR-1 bacterium RIFOXYC12_FULL_54_18]OGC30811.1 MAG: NrdH-redoxin [candidate division WOR-1 bacterium RIFOXYB12_FULL_52_16]
MLSMTVVPGKDKGKVKLYTLSTCVWCKKVKKLLNELKVAYDYVDVDLLEEEAKAEAKEEVAKFNPACSFPTLVLNDKKCIVGFDEGKINQELG